MIAYNTDKSKKIRKCISITESINNILKSVSNEFGITESAYMTSLILKDKKEREVNKYVRYTN